MERDIKGNKGIQDKGIKRSGYTMVRIYKGVRVYNDKGN